MSNDNGRMSWNCKSLSRVIFLSLISLPAVVSFPVITRPNKEFRTINTNLFSTTSEDGWKWKGHDIYTRPISSSTEGKQKILLIHGFGCSTTYWRSTIDTLEKDGRYEVHSLDLLGQGYSAKPSSVTYTINLWANQVDDYIQHITASCKDEDDDFIIIGNSLGSLIALAAATKDYKDEKVDDFPKKIQGICMCNCANGLNSKGTINEPNVPAVVKIIFTVLYSILELVIFKNKRLLQYLLDEKITKDVLKETLQGLYKHDPSRIDEELVNSFYEPAQQPGAVDALSQIYANEPGKTPMDLHDEYATLLQNYFADGNPLPIHLVWGNDDAITPVGGGVGTFYSQLAGDSSTAVTMDMVHAGHVPFDDNPESTNASILKWTNTLLTTRETSMKTTSSVKDIPYFLTEI